MHRDDLEIFKFTLKSSSLVIPPPISHSQNLLSLVPWENGEWIEMDVPEFTSASYKISKNIGMTIASKNQMKCDEEEVQLGMIRQNYADIKEK